MSNEEFNGVRNGGTSRVHGEQITSLRERVAQLEALAQERGEKYTQILVELAVLKTRVGYLAAGIGAVTGVVSSLATSLVMVVIKQGIS